MCRGLPKIKKSGVLSRFFYFVNSDLKYSSYSSSVRFGSLFFFAMQHLFSFERSMPYPSAFYSVLSAMTGSFFAAAAAGMSPEMSVSATLMSTMIPAVRMGSEAIPEIPERE